MHESEVDYVIDGGDDAAPEIPNPPPTDIDRAVAQLIAAEIEDGSCLQIGIGAMPNAVCSLLLEQRRARPRHPHRDADRRHHRPLPGRRRHRRPQDALPRQDRLHLRARDEDAVRDGRPQPRLPLPRRRPDQPAAHRDAERPRGRDQQHDADGPAGPGRQRVRRPPPHQRHGRAVAVRARRLRLEGRQVVHLHVVDLRAPRRAREPHRRRPDARQRRHRARAPT